MPPQALIIPDCCLGHTWDMPTYPYSLARDLCVAASPPAVFAWMDDPARLVGHMDTPSPMLLGGRLTASVDGGRGQAVGSRIRLSGSVLGLTLDLEEVVIEREPPFRKAWATTRPPRLLVIGPYRMGFTVTPAPGGSHVRLTLDYALPASGVGRVLGRLLAPAYAGLCLHGMLRDLAAAFASGRP